MSNIVTQILCAVKGLRRASTPNQLAILQQWTLDGGVGEGSTHTSTSRRDARSQGKHPVSSEGASAMTESLSSKGVDWEGEGQKAAAVHTLSLSPMERRQSPIKLLWGRTFSKTLTQKGKQLHNIMAWAKNKKAPGIDLKRNITHLIPPGKKCRVILNPAGKVNLLERTTSDQDRP